MKYILKKDIDEIARLERKYKETSDVEILHVTSLIGDKISSYYFGTTTYWYRFVDLVSCCIDFFATNEQIYKVFETLGIKIVESEVEDDAEIH